MTNKKYYQSQIISARGALRDGLVIKAYDILGEILADMEKIPTNEKKDVCVRCGGVGGHHDWCRDKLKETYT